ncbi:TetR/AcrR family transcriptional regulator [Streptomyces sp. NPDC102279]|uniref:TetR/AcrR family transcriptional regulator n=1 Tax=Streptomyces sp. NPDC102279 TaxID=3366153 RepID=UPI0037F293AF
MAARSTQDVSPDTGTGAKRRAQYSSGASEKGKRTRALLLAAARSVFERAGYVDARVADIVSAAGVSHGTFYTYFEAKVDVFRALIAEVSAELVAVMEAPIAGDEGTHHDIAARLRAANGAYLDVYRKNAALMMLNEQQASIDPEVMKYRIEARRAHVNRITESLQRMQRMGVARRDLDCRTVAAALAGMVSNFAYYWYALGEPFDEDLARTTLTDLWLGAIGYPRSQAGD